MASVCEICGKGPGFGNNVSFSHRRTRRRFNPNIQHVRAMVERHAQAAQRVHLLHQGRQGHPLGLGWPAAKAAGLDRNAK